VYRNSRDIDAVIVFEKSLIFASLTLNILCEPLRAEGYA